MLTGAAPPCDNVEPVHQEDDSGLQGAASAPRLSEWPSGWRSLRRIPKHTHTHTSSTKSSVSLREGSEPDPRLLAWTRGSELGAAGASGPADLSRLLLLNHKQADRVVKQLTAAASVGGLGIWLLALASALAWLNLQLKIKAAALSFLLRSVDV